MKPELVHRNEPVVINYEMPGMTLTMRGKAMESGAEGDLVNVMNVQSKRNVQGVVAGSGRVVVMTTSPAVVQKLASSAPEGGAASPQSK
jgi:flagella basal body P-ring formation protein FlgA